MTEIGRTDRGFESLWDMNLKRTSMRHPGYGTLKLWPWKNRMYLSCKCHFIDIGCWPVPIRGRDLREISICYEIQWIRGSVVMISNITHIHLLRVVHWYSYVQWFIIPLPDLMVWIGTGGAGNSVSRSFRLPPRFGIRCLVGDDGVLLDSIVSFVFALFCFCFATFNYAYGNRGGMTSRSCREFDVISLTHSWLMCFATRQHCFFLCFSLRCSFSGLEKTKMVRGQALCRSVNSGNCGKSAIMQRRSS